MEKVGYGEESNKSKVWLIAYNKGKNKVRKTLIYEYLPGDTANGPDDWYQHEGIVIQHKGTPVYYHSYDNDFSVGSNIIPYKLYDNRDMSHLEGKLLTLVDATLIDKEQRDALKSLISQTLWRFNGDQESKIEEMFKSVDCDCDKDAKKSCSNC